VIHRMAGQSKDYLEMRYVPLFSPATSPFFRLSRNALRPPFFATDEFAARAAAPKEIGFGWESRGSPIYSAGLCSRAASHTPVARRVRLTVASSSVLAFTLVSRARRPRWKFRGCRVHSYHKNHRNCYGPRAGSPSFRGRLHSSLRRRGHPQSASNITTWINSQFPRPDFHRQVQRHYELQDTINLSIAFFGTRERYSGDWFSQHRKPTHRWPPRLVGRRRKCLVSRPWSRGCRPLARR
jgi:hypothetical protein